MDIFELAFLIDQGININGLSIEDSTDRALSMFLDPYSLSVFPERTKLSPEQWAVLGQTEYKRWH